MTCSHCTSRIPGARNSQMNADPEPRHHYSRVAVWLACCIAFVAYPARSADAKRDPKGWGKVRFGMTAREVVNVLDGAASFQQDKQAPQKPLTIDEDGTPDLRRALEIAKQILADAKDKGDASPAIEAARRLVKLIKPRQWMLYGQGGPDDTGMPTKTLSARLSGTLEGFEPAMLLGFAGGPGGDSEKRARVVIRPPNKRLQPVTWGGVFESFDDASVAYIQEVQGAVSDLADHGIVERQEEMPRDAERHRELEVDRIMVRGVELQPAIEFRNGTVNKVALFMRDSGDGGANFDEFGMHRTLCEALEEKFGPPDERNNGAASAETVWRFPETVITCSRSRISFPDSGFIRKGVCITYAKPSNENSGEDDNL